MKELEKMRKRLKDGEQVDYNSLSEPEREAVEVILTETRERFGPPKGEQS